MKNKKDLIENLLTTNTIPVKGTKLSYKKLAFAIIPVSVAFMAATHLIPSIVHNVLITRSHHHLLSISFTVNYISASVITLITCLVAGALWRIHSSKQKALALREEKKERKLKDFYDQVRTHLKIQKSIARFALDPSLNDGFSPDKAPCLTRFSSIQNNTECLFAKRAKFWGCKEWDPKLSIEENVRRSVPTLIQFSALAFDEKMGLDGFVFEIHGQKEYFDSITSFAKSVNRIITAFASNDPTGYNCMRNPDFVNTKAWKFLFAGTSFFITTFFPGYDETHSRHAFGIEDSAFVLFQPEISFNFHNLPEDDTVREEHEFDLSNIRHAIRRNFMQAGRKYHIPESVFYENSHHIVKPLDYHGDVVRWWTEI